MPHNAAERKKKMLKCAHTLHIDAKKIAKYEDLMAGAVDYAANGIEPNAIIEDWTTNFWRGVELNVSLHSGDAAKQEPLWLEVAMVCNGQKQKPYKSFGQIVGDYEARDMYGDQYYLSLMPFGDLAIADPKVLDIELEGSNDIEIVAGDMSAVTPEYEDYVEYYIPVYFDPDKAFNVNFHTASNDSAWLNVYVHYYPANNDISMFVYYDSDVCSDCFGVKLDEEEKAHLREALFTKAEKTYGKTPTEEWDAATARNNEDDGLCYVLTRTSDPTLDVEDNECTVYRDREKALADMNAQADAVLASLRSNDKDFGDATEYPVKREENGFATTLTITDPDDGIGYDTVYKWVLAEAKMKED